MTFPCLFILLPQIESLGLYSHLGNRNRIAAKISDSILNPQVSGTDYLSEKNNAVYPVLKWMLESSADEENTDDGFCRVMDIVISVLINTYRDKSVLPTVEELIFRRHKAGLNIHDLIWAFFRIGDPFVLELLAEHVRSSDPEEAALACRLLNINAGSGNDESGGKQKLYEDYFRWVGENKPFLYFTGECFQATNEPVFCRIDLQKKNEQIRAAGSGTEEMP
jgi:hypothetical protein